MKHLRRHTNKTTTAAAGTVKAVSAPPSVIPTYLETMLFELLLLLLYLGGMFGCLITGFSFSVFPTVLCAGLPMLAAVQIVCGRAGKSTFLAAAAQVLLLAVWTWLRIDVLTEGLCYLTTTILRHLCWGFPGITMPQMLSEYEQFLIHAETNELLLSSIRAPQTECILYLSVLCGMLWYFLYRQNQRVWLAAALPLPAFILCFLIIEATIPALWALLLILLYWALLLFTRGAVRLHTRAASAQAVFLLLPCVLFLSAVYLWYPRTTPVGALVQSGYDRVLRVISTLETTVSDAAGGIFSGNLFTVSAEGSEISFDSLNPRRFLGRTVMRAKCDTTGVIYLRENTYGRFSEEGWKQTVFDGVHAAEPEPEFQMASASLLAASGVSPSRLTLDGARSPLLFTPYYFSDSSASYAYDGDSRISNPDRTPDYEIAFYRFSGNFDSLQHNEAAGASMLLTWYMQKIVPAYREIDSALAEELRALLLENGVTDSAVFEHSFVMEDGSLRTYTDYDTMWQTVSDITHFVRSSAKYSLNADKNTTDRNFVLWFLEDAEYGYCTHFATAEVMLLRACGIPARLAAGYLGSIRTADTWTAIKDSNAHAWAEVYDYRLGWIPVEATPPSELSPDMDPDDIIVGMQPIPSEDTAETTAVTETVPPDETEPPVPGTEEDTAADTSPTSPPDDGMTPAQPTTGDGSGSSGGTSGGPTAGKLHPQLLRTMAVILTILLSAAILALLLIFCRRTRRRHLDALFYPEEENRNLSALRLYRRCVALARACGESVPDRLTALAEKARFSQHILAQEELDVFRSWYEERCAVLQKNDKPLPRLRHYWIDLYY